MDHIRELEAFLRDLRRKMVELESQGAEPATKAELAEVHAALLKIGDVLRGLYLQ